MKINANKLTNRIVGENSWIVTDTGNKCVQLRCECDNNTGIMKKLSFQKKNMIFFINLSNGSAYINIEMTKFRSTLQKPIYPPTKIDYWICFMPFKIPPYAILNYSVICHSIQHPMLSDWMVKFGFLFMTYEWGKYALQIITPAFCKPKMKIYNVHVKLTADENAVVPPKLLH